MTRRLRRPVADFAIAVITIFAIAGTLSACGRYGSPVRVVPSADSTARPLEEETASTNAEPSVEAEPVEEEHE